MISCYQGLATSVSSTSGVVIAVKGLYRYHRANLRTGRYNLYDMTHSESYYKKDQLIQK